MQIQISKLKLDTDLAILPLFEGQKTFFDILPIAKSDFKNFLGSTHLIYNSQAPKRILLIGLGSKNKFKISDFRVVMHSAMQICKNLEINSATLILPQFSSTILQSVMEMVGFSLTFSLYQFDVYKKNAKQLELEQIFIVSKTSKVLSNALQRGIIIGEAANEARNLANHPGNIATPTLLAKHAQEIAKKYKFRCKILGPKEIAQEKLGLLQGVAKGSTEPSRFVVMEYRPASRQTAKLKPPIVLIGKGLTFDSGGISLKPADKMEEMKFDMCGGATVLGIFEAVARLKLNVHLVGLIPSTENLVSGQALKPGDVLIAHDQTSVEIINTDAEGRLVLADAISFAKKYYKPKLMIDYATLTGAVLIALGNLYTGLFSNTKEYSKDFEDSSKLTGEKFWHLPLAEEYKAELKSQIADIKNIGDKGSAGATTAALFLEKFVGQVPWIHLDIAGTAWATSPKPYTAVGATAWGVYLTIDFLRNA
jgi:leucyl aminopeptidase